ncbi:MAG: hypothetical protein LQ346_007090 [Caloplaca aetnensis]|nr:MAG: hypothetical protein LQ346_007090 [Caloplaca aetnensis]
MPSIICTIISSIAAAIIGLLSAPLLNEYGLVPYYSTISSHPTHIPVPTFFDDDLYSFIHQPYINASVTTSTSATDAFPGSPVDCEHKPSSSTTSSPPTAAPTPVSAKSFYRRLFTQLASHLLSILAGLSLRLVDFCRLNPTTSYNRLIVVKRRYEHPSNAVLSTSGISIACDFEPTSPVEATTSDDKVAATSTSSPPSPTSQEQPASSAWAMSGVTNFYASSPAKSTVYVDQGTDVPTLLPSTPTPAAPGKARYSLPPRPSWAAGFDPKAGTFIPRPAGPSTDTPVQFAQKHPMHGKKAPGF